MQSNAGLNQITLEASSPWPLAQGLSAPQFASSTNTSRRSTQQGSSHPRRILVIDDEHLIADTLSRILNLNGFVAHAAYSGDAALELIPELCPDIVLTDVRMPGMNGIEVGRLIQAQCPNTRVVLFSGDAGMKTIDSKTDRNTIDFELWPKPIHPRELVERLKKL